MIRYALKCAQGHSFESWFQSASAYDRLAAAGHVACAVCGSAEVEKALMAPRVAGEAAAEPPPAAETPGPDAPEQAPLSRPASVAEQAMAELRRRIERESDYVGDRFATEARRMHEGDSPHRAIHGEARPDEARALIEEGVPVTPLPFLSRRKTN